jgi:hypothetical protein
MKFQNSERLLLFLNFTRDPTCIESRVQLQCNMRSNEQVSMDSMANAKMPDSSHHTPSPRGLPDAYLPGSSQFRVISRPWVLKMTTCRLITHQSRSQTDSAAWARRACTPWHGTRRNSIQESAQTRDLSSREEALGIESLNPDFGCH